MRLIGYIRVSRVAGREGPTFITVEDQRKRIEATATASGHTLIDWEQDLDQPGSRLERPGLQAALEAVEAGAADGIIVAKLDRFARSLIDAVAAIQRLSAAGGQLVSVEDGFDSSTSMGRFARDIILRIGELELDRIRENWVAAGAHAAGRGVHVSRVPPVGYQRGDDKRLEIEPLAGPVIRELFQRRGAGESWPSLCRFLDQRLPRANGGHWATSTVTSIIACRTYLGEARGGGIVNDDAHPPLVTRTEWEAAQAAQADGRRDRGYDGGALLAGLIRCGSCGHTMTRFSDGARGYYNYKCRKRHGDSVCPQPTGISLSRADDHIEREFLAALEREPLAAKGKAADGRVEDALAELEAAEAELDIYRDETVIAALGKDAYVEGLLKRQQAVDQARAHLADANRATPLDGIRDLAAVWPGLDRRERRHLLGTVLERVVVAPAPGSGRGARAEERLSIVWR